MIMTLNDVLTKQNVLAQVILTDGDKELSKALKVKIMRMRMAYNKVKSNFDEDVKKFQETLVSDELRTLATTSRDEAQEARFKELEASANAEYAEFLSQKGLEEVTLGMEDKFTEEDYEDLIEVNAGNNVVINGNSIKAADFLEIIYNLFVV